MKLLTLNCHSWQEENQLEKIKYLAQIIKENDYDIIALQEVSQHIENNLCEGILREDNYMVLLKNELKKLNADNYESVWDFSHMGYDVYEEGLCLLSKHPIVEKESFYITNGDSKYNWKSRKVVKASVDCNGEVIDFVSCHLGWWNDDEEPFKVQVENLNKRINNDRQTFLLGDFNNNANIRNEGYDFIKSTGWIDTYDLAYTKDEGITVKGKIDGWEENKSKLRLDLILSNNDLKVKSSNVVFNGVNKEVVSDHYGVEVEL